jgi:hypothetical protein
MMQLSPLQWYDEQIQKHLEPICEKLPKLRVLLCNSTGEEIGANDSVYYDRNGVIKAQVRDPVESLYLGTLDEIRNWCRHRCDSIFSPKEIQIDKGSIEPFLSDFMFRNLLESHVLEPTCLIVTAAYGSDSEQQVIDLKAIRDRCRMKSKVFSRMLADFEAFYYEISPLVSQAMLKSSGLKKLIRMTCVAPTLIFLHAFLPRLTYLLGR